MCDPVTATLVAATALTATGQVMQGIQAKQQGKYENAVAQQNVAMVRQEQADQKVTDVQQQVRLARQYSQLKGGQTAQMAANGVDLNFGSPATALSDTDMLYSEDAANLSHNQDVQNRGFDINVANYTAQGQAAKMKGQAGLTSDLFGAGSTILSGASQYAKFQFNKAHGLGY